MPWRRRQINEHAMEEKKDKWICYGGEERRKIQSNRDWDLWIVIENQHHWTWNKPICTLSSPADAKQCGCWFYQLHIDWPHVRSVLICSPCYLFHYQSPTSTGKNKQYPQWPFYSSNCPLLPKVYAFYPLPVFRQWVPFKPDYPLFHCYEQLLVPDSKSKVLPDLKSVERHDSLCYLAKHKMIVNF